MGMLVLKCLWEFTLLIRFWFMLSGGWKGLLCLPDSIIDSDFAGLNDRSHLTAQACVMARPAFSSSAALMGLSTIIKRLVSSAKSLMQKCISSTISLMYMRKKERA